MSPKIVNKRQTNNLRKGKMSEQLKKVHFTFFSCEPTCRQAGEPKPKKFLLNEVSNGMRQNLFIIFNEQNILCPDASSVKLR